MQNDCGNKDEWIEAYYSDGINEYWVRVKASDYECYSLAFEALCERAFYLANIGKVKNE